jgi:hypothetical protein
MAERLEDLLRASTVRVLGGPMPGTGFFVTPGRVLTCVHVIGDAAAATLTVRWERDGREAASFPVTDVLALASRGRPIPALDRDYPDIAVLEVGGVESHGCVLMDARRPSDGDGLVVYGFPEEGGAVHLTPARLTYRGPHGIAPTSYWDLGSDTVKPGMSGSAVLNVRTGGVGGIVVATKHPARADGALAVPWEEVAAELQDVLACNRAFHQGDHRWSEAVSAMMPPVPVPPPTAVVADEDRLGGHAFISYVHEDAAEVDWLQQALKSVGVPVWRDTVDLWPGENWRDKIREAIARDALVFIACFSRRSVARSKSHQYEELRLAIDQLRLRPPSVLWLIPVRFDECDIPDFDLGRGQMLSSIQRVDLFGANRDLAAGRLMATVQRLLP